MASLRWHGPHPALNSGVEHTHHVLLVDLLLSWQHHSLCSRRRGLSLRCWSSRWTELPGFPRCWYLASFILWGSAKLSHFELAVSNIFGLWRWQADSIVSCLLILHSCIRFCTTAGMSRLWSAAHAGCGFWCQKACVFRYSLILCIDRC